MKRTLFAMCGLAAITGAILLASTPTQASMQIHNGYDVLSPQGQKVESQFKAIFGSDAPTPVKAPVAPLGEKAPPAGGVIDARPQAPRSYMILRERRAPPVAAVPRPS